MPLRGDGAGHGAELRLHRRADCGDGICDPLAGETAENCVDCDDNCVRFGNPEDDNSYKCVGDQFCFTLKGDPHPDQGCEPTLTVGGTASACLYSIDGQIVVAPGGDPCDPCEPIPTNPPLNQEICITLCQPGELILSVTQACDCMSETDVLRIIVEEEISIGFERFDPINWALSECSNNGGMRIFPDKVNHDDPDAAAFALARRMVNAKIHVCANRAGQTVHMKVFDVDDPSTADAPVDLNDSNGPMGSDNRNPISEGLVFSEQTDGNGDVLVPFEVSQNPGDNYRVIASFDLDLLNSVTQSMADEVDPLPEHVVMSEMLTVWRHVFIELDSMDSQSEVSHTWLERKINAFEGPNGTNALASALTKFTNIEPQLFEVTFEASEKLAVWEEGAEAAIAPGAPLNNSINIPATQILSNDGSQVTFIGPTSIIPAAGLLFEANDGNGGEMTGTVSEVTRTGGNYVYSLSVVGGDPNWGDFVGGDLTMAGGDPVSITGANGVQSTVTANGFSVLVWFRDDDSQFLLPKLPDVSIMQPTYAPAYILPQANGGNVGAFSQLDAPFQQHIEGGSSHLEITFGLPNQGSRLSERDDCWIAHLLSAHEGSLFSDQDGQDLFSAVLGGASAGSNVSNTEVMAGGHIAVVFLEVLRDVIAANPGALPPHIEAIVCAHETGHQFGLDHISGTLMGPAHDFGNAEFAPIHLHLLRSRVRSPGE